MGKPKRKLPPGMTYADVLAMQHKQVKAIREAAERDAVRIESGIQTQRAMWLMVVAMADAFGLGPVRVERFTRALQAAADEFSAMEAETDTDYALEKLRLRAEQVSGMKIEHLFEKDLMRMKEELNRDDPTSH